MAGIPSYRELAECTLGIVTATPPDRHVGFANWALSSDTERSLEE